MSAEVQLKAAVIDRLFRAGEVCDDAVIISEMVVDQYSRRADLVVANGKLSAFEVKSELDSLVRLPGQIETFYRLFEKLTIVVAARFEKRATELLPDGVGLWIAHDRELVERRRAKQRVLEPSAYLSLMTVADLRRLLSANGFSDIHNLPRRELTLKATSLPSKDIAAAARSAVKRRYRLRHESLLMTRANCSTEQALMNHHRSVRSPSPVINTVASMPTQTFEPGEHPMLILLRNAGV